MTTVHIVVQNGLIESAFCLDPNTEVVIYDLDCQDPEERAYIEGQIANLRDTTAEIDIF